MLSNKTKSSNGFTIVELIVALSVSAIVLATGYELFRTFRSVGEKQDESLAECEEIIGVLDQVRDDLAHAVPKAYEQEAVFIGNNPTFDFKEFKLLQFYSFCAVNYSDKAYGIRQIHRIEYELVKEKDSICLYRTAKVIGDNNSNTPSNDGYKKLILEKIDSIQVAFNTAGQLKPSFSSNQYLPVYVGLELTAYGQTWPLVVKLPCGAMNAE
jgi:prepilin-type N-terminal cleavage/methylation domain-containing protein